MAGKKKDAAAVADTVAAGAIEGAGAALDAGGDSRDVAAATIGGAAAATSEATGSAPGQWATDQAEASADARASEQDGQPVDDHVSQFDKRVDRLTEIALEAEFANGTLVGDIRDALLDTFKHRPKPWSQMSADEMRDMNKGLETIAKTLIRKIVHVVAEEDDVSVAATIKGYSVKGDTFQIKVEASGDEETAIELFRMDGHDVVILRADAKRFHGQKRDAEVIPDQAALAFADDEPKAIPPADDSDLAGAGPNVLTPVEDDDFDPGVETPEGFGSDDGQD